MYDLLVVVVDGGSVEVGGELISAFLSMDGAPFECVQDDTNDKDDSNNNNHDNAGVHRRRSAAQCRSVNN